MEPVAGSGKIRCRFCPMTFAKWYVDKRRMLHSGQVILERHLWRKHIMTIERIRKWAKNETPVADSKQISYHSKTRGEE